MKICDVCHEKVQDLYPVCLFVKGGTGDICPSCAAVYRERKKKETEERKDEA